MIIKSFLKWCSLPVHQKYSLFLKPFIQGLFWFLTFILAAYASLYSSEIKDFKIPESWEAFKSASMNWHTLIFACGATLAAFIVSITIWVKSSREDFLFAVIQTSPPAGFWTRHHEAILRATEQATLIELWAYESEKEERVANRQKAEKAVRVILDDLINLIMEWDESNLARKVVYRANIMEVIHFDEQPNYVVSDGLDRFLIKPEHSHYSGVIVLNDNKYTTTTKSKQPDPDAEIKPILFPFTRKDDDKPSRFQHNLRGAPYAVVSGSHCYVGDVEEIVEHYKKHANPSDKDIHSKLEEYYYKKDYPAHSILSIPLYGTTTDGTKIERFVVNLYRNQPNMLYRGEKAKEFFYVATGLTSKLESILAAIHDPDNAFNDPSFHKCTCPCTCGAKSPVSDDVQDS
ncbi:hypothetical protein D6V10_07905 [Vibrio cholerae]|uniref:hypothetical protein n=1 Tax=Vibrio cholerae TaxID=666 RepID=UPI0011821049|nr:hypothetical protein [Vibrio cholerae]MVC22366.1 hypothetical protein [Vibrio cholerae]TVN18967.1 hypothetical protein FPW20_08005 [Vibrio cholerae]